MYIKDLFPDRLQEFSNPNNFAEVMDSLQQYKQEIVSESLRVYNPALLTDKKWLLKRLSDYGITDMPIELPLIIIQQYLLNSDVIFRTRGSKIGIELYCSVLSLGEVTVDDSDFYYFPKNLVLSSTVQGFITDNSEGDQFHLVGDTGILDNVSSLVITIKSKYFNGNYPDEAKYIQQYLKDSINANIGFTTKKDVTFVFESNTEFYFHKLLNPYFV